MAGWAVYISDVARRLTWQAHGDLDLELMFKTQLIILEVICGDAKQIDAIHDPRLPQIFWWVLSRGRHDTWPS